MRRTSHLALFGLVQRRATMRRGGLLLALLSSMLLAASAFAQGGRAVAIGGGGMPLPGDEISPAEYARIEAAISANIQALRQSGQLPVAVKKATPSVSLQWPVRMVPGHPERDARTISNFVDHDPAFPHHVLEYMCDSRTYDTPSGYNHQGTDITAFPFGLRKMDNDEAIVVAAAPGIIVYREDGQFDRNCAMSNLAMWNAVYVQHADGSIAWYGHLKAHSLTTKRVGDAVDVGEFLGVMGSSGSSTGPHLHFELHDADGNVIDPFAGPCNGQITESLWAVQRPYFEPAINSVLTGDAAPELDACPVAGTSHGTAYFQSGQTIYVTAFLRDQHLQDSAVFNLYRPDGTKYASQTIVSNADFYPASYWYWALPLPAAAASGDWRFEVAFAGQTQSVGFHVGATEPPRGSVIEYYNATLDHYFVTAFLDEAAALDAGAPVAGWKRTGAAFPGYVGNGAGLATVCRFFGTPGRGVNSHFYTAFPSECAIVKNNADWTFEANAFYISTPPAVQCPAATRPVFRLYNNGLGGQPNHRYTTSWPVVNRMQTQGWVLEGVVMCTPL